ncbi:hypothetical protein B0J14DRAFT_673745, partial [Halenospora varia]
ELPSSYDQALSALEAYLEQELLRRAHWLRTTICCRPGFAGEAQRKKNAFSPSEIFETYRVNFCLIHLILRIGLLDDIAKYTRNHVTTYDHTVIFGILDEILTRQFNKVGCQSDTGRLDQLLYDAMVDFSTIHQMLTMIRLHWPRCKKRHVNDFRENLTGKPWKYMNNRVFDLQDYQGDKEFKPSPFDDHPKREIEQQREAANSSLASLIIAFLRTEAPKGSKYSIGWVNEDIEQREALSRFWSAVKERYRRMLTYLGIGEEDLASDLELLSANQDPHYVASIEAEHKAIRKTMEERAAQAAAALTSGSGVGQTQWGADQQLKHDRTSTWTTSGGPTSSLRTRNLTLTEEPREVIKATVSRATYAVFAALFPKQNFDEPLQKSVKWDDFVRAMTDPKVGCVARQNGGDSAVTFEPSEGSQWARKGKICFHRPHPDAVLDPIMLRGNAKRLARWFGWNEETFVLEERGGARAETGM